MIKHIIDIHNIKKDSPLFIAILDVEAAYDKVPHEAIHDGLRRLHAPEKLISILKSMNKSRSLQIDTPFGLSEAFFPILGLAQGSILAPLLWNIFYEPLMLLLQKHTVGIKPNIESPEESRISSVAYADDLHPIANTIADMQTQLDFIHDFLKYHNMNINVTPTSTKIMISTQAQPTQLN